MSNPYGHFFWQLREMQRTLDQLGPRLDVYSSIPDIITEQFDLLRSLEERFTLPTFHLDAIDGVREQLIASGSGINALTSLAETHATLFRHIEDSSGQVADLANRYSELAELARNPIESIVDSLVPFEALVNSIDLSGPLLDAAVQPVVAFERFVESQQALLESAASAFEVRNRLEFIEAAGGLLEDTSNAAELAILMARDLVPTPSPEDWEVNLYLGLAQAAEEVDFSDKEFSAEEFVEERCEAGIVDLGRRLVRLIYDLNTEAEREGEEDVFTPTNKSMHACMIIPTQVATEDRSFDFVVDQLYFLLYEGSGAAKRLISKWGEEHLDALWRLKHLRLGARHDLAHGDKQSISKKMKNIAAAFDALIGSSVPKIRRDWCRAQLALYEQLIEMLERLWFEDPADTDNSELLDGADDPKATPAARRSSR